MYTQKNNPTPINSAVCDGCGSSMMLFSAGKITCKNCGEVVVTTKKSNKYGAKRTEMNGQIYDSAFEASTAWSLEVRKKAGDILDYETQFKITCWAYREDGSKAFKVDHKVDFRIHHKDGSYELLETKGVETDDYKWRRKFLENIWLPDHPDHIYTVEKQNTFYKKKRKA